MTSNEMTTYALIVGGGTAGHVLPGVAIGAELVDRGHDPSTIHFVGSERGVERTIVPEAGFEQTLLPGRGIQRRLTTENLGALRGLLDAFRQAKSIVDDRRPSVVVALGGYASVPAGVWAAIRRIPIVVAEQNAVPGLANRLIGRFAKASAVSFDGTDLPRATWTGNPVRQEILNVGFDIESTRRMARERLGLAENTRLVVVFGGSLGARTINNATMEAIDILAERDDVHVRHIIGKRDFADISRKAERRLEGPLTYTPVEYENDMASVFAAADLVVCRAGATSCAELAVTGTPSVLIPLPGAPGDHQTANARALERVGGAELVPDALVDGPMIARTIERLLEDPETLAEMRTHARSIARPDAAAAVVDLVERYGGTA